MTSEDLEHYKQVSEESGETRRERTAMENKVLKASATLIIFEHDGEDWRTVGEFRFTLPYGDATAQTEPLRKLKPEYVGVVLGGIGNVAAISSDLPRDNPWYRDSAQKIERAQATPVDTNCAIS